MRLKISKMFKLFKSRRGCTKGKTKAEKEEYFKSLASFTGKDNTFFREQYNDLTPLEKREFTNWLLKDLDL